MLIKGEGKYSESFGKSGKLNTVINHEKFFKEESVKDADSKTSWIKNVSKADRYVSFPVIERNFVFSCINKFP